MLNTFLHGPKNLMNAWKSLRKQLTDDITELEQLMLITKFWSLAPLSTRSLDWDNPQLWPNAWQLIHSQEFDENSISLAMFYTLILSSDSHWTYDRLSLILVKDNRRQIQKIILRIDNRWIMNLDYNLVVDSNVTPVNLSIQQKYIFDGKQHFSVDNRKNISNTS